MKRRVERPLCAELVRRPVFPESKRKIEMFLPPQRTAIMVTMCLLTASVSTALGQTTEYERRLAAMHQARGRALEAYEDYNADNSVRVAQYDDYSSQQVRQATTPANQSMQRRMQQSGPPRQMQMRQTAAPISNGSRVVRAPQYSGRASNMRVAQLNEQPIPAGGSPVIQHGVYQSVEGIIDDGGYYNDDMGDQCCESSCGFCNSGVCCDRGVCPPGDCWLGGLGAILCRGDYFFGAQGFQTPMYAVPGTANEFNHDGNFGFYGGFNLGLPLCRLSCGLFAGQFGIRSVQTNFGGNAFATDNRDQLFLTTGLYRRVDYGIQGGVVADILWDNWYTNANVAQLRAEIAHLWAGGTSFGFRYHTNLSNDTTSGIIRGQIVDNIFTTTIDSYRFYLRHEAHAGGFGEVFVGWTDFDQTIFGGEIDVPITDRLATQAGVTYYLDDTVPPTASNRLGGYMNEAWNVYAGFSFRPCGRSYYRNYDRPFFNVADNGSMLLQRE
jgi:hypothetical protein